MNEVTIELTMADMVKVFGIADEHDLTADEVIELAKSFSLAQEKAGANKSANSALGAIADTVAQITQLFSDLSEQLDTIENNRAELPCFLRK